MELNVVLYINNEIELTNPDSIIILTELKVQVESRYQLISAENQQEAEIYCREYRDRMLILAATDDTCLLAERMHIPCAAIILKNYPQESLMKAQMLFLDPEAITVIELERIFQRYYEIPWKILETDRCVLWEISVADLDELYEMYQKPGMGEFLEPLHNRSEEEERLKAYVQNMYGFYGFGIWIVRSKTDGRMLGRAGFSIGEAGGEAVLELGYVITPEERRKGYAKELIQALLIYAKEELQEYQTIVAYTDMENIPSQELLLQQGFVLSYNNLQKQSGSGITFNRCFFRENSL